MADMRLFTGISTQGLYKHVHGNQIKVTCIIETCVQVDNRYTGPYGYRGCTDQMSVCTRLLHKWSQHICIIMRTAELMKDTAHAWLIDVK